MGTCCLKLATVCIGSGSLGKDSSASQCQLLPVSGPGQPVQSCGYPQSVAAPSAPECMQKGPRCPKRLAFISTGPGGRSSKVAKHPKIYLILPSLLADSQTQSLEQAQSLLLSMVYAPQHGVRGIPRPCCTWGSVPPKNDGFWGVEE